jgi:DNA polymerase III subunit gamma/tau
MYYLKYRPQTLTDIDNNTRQILLQNVLSNPKEVPRTFLLTGPKGTGKTSTARIIAKILNCEKNIFAGKSQTVDPCNQCDNCIAINRNNFLDVNETDGASNRGIDDIRSLRDQVYYAPNKGRYKVYIIDEVHMLTREAFNALLKTLEEPPSFVVFILATTEAHKLPETISSRCLNISFNKATTEEIVHSLQRIVSAEKLVVEPQVLEYIAGKAGGSFRDAAKYLELVVKSTDLSLTQVEMQLSVNLILNPDDLVSLIMEGKQQEILKYLEEFSQKGGSAAHLIEELLLRLQKMLIDEKIGNGKKADIAIPKISHLIKKLLTAYQQTRFSPVDILPLQIAFVDND